MPRSDDKYLKRQKKSAIVYVLENRCLLAHLWTTAFL